MLDTTIKTIVQPGKGILAADESTGTIGKRFDSIRINNNPENRHDYRLLLAQTESLNQYISGIILYEETLLDDVIRNALNKQNIVLGIKVDGGLVDYEGNSLEKTTQGLDGLADRLAIYREKGARFAKWRAVFTISETTPSACLTHIQAENLARYAAICQAQQIVPIVEPEVLMDGTHSIEDCERVTTEVLRSVFQSLVNHEVCLEKIILKPNMVISGKECHEQASPAQVAEATIRTLRRTVPAAVPSINFLSGGQNAEQATLHLQLMNKEKQPWMLSFSYGRALQDACLKTWSGKTENLSAAQRVLLECAKRNSLATQGL